MLQAHATRNTYDLKFRSDAARVKGVACLKGAEGLTVTPHDRFVEVTVLYLNFEVDQRRVARALSQYFGQPRTCLKRGEEGHEARPCPNRRCDRCLQVGHDKEECPNEVLCKICGEEEHVSGSCPTSYSAHIGTDVEQAPEPLQPGPEYTFGGGSTRSGTGFPRHQTV
ncbi:Zinc finger CCHC domain-containing protein 3 [Holothuria leucospilota]|uniref:Zinc finger CCHC domain-containing protein 3 n=1 Tax=Holothuria leucospilota TaxID=206669 RepID=A0A9Q1BPU8_HOLLE|nr:Zinc finger CCHC domain-containing protein 3 [Holothuria leucospilota]